MVLARARAHMSLVRAQRNPTTGAVVVAQIVLTESSELGALRSRNPGTETNLLNELQRSVGIQHDRVRGPLKVALLRLGFIDASIQS